ncbi:MAG TPA: Xaa-Pro peptidase family protein [Candidatus Limnocylindrales bacterium]|nr:Xaa-Pro peptidase family protein [Candidatus Limnocylindrales bacterium]
MKPTGEDLRRWADADGAARPRRLDGLRERMTSAGVDAYFGVRRENTRYLTGFELGEGEEKVAGNSGQFIVGRDDVMVLADSRYTAAATKQCSGSHIERVYNDIYDRWPEMLASLGDVKRVAVEAGFVSHAMWQRLDEAAPSVELVPAEGWVESLRQVKEPSELERVAAACAVADAALQQLLPQIKAGVTEHELALQLEWEMRTNGAEALAFDVACLAGAQAALPHGAPTDRSVKNGEVLLFDFGAQVAGYRSDMTRTLFVGEPTAQSLEIYEVVARAQEASFEALSQALADGSRPSGRSIHMIAKRVIVDAGYGDHFGHGLGHGIGLATHEMPGLGMSAPDVPLPSPTVFSIEPGIYLDGVTGVRIEDLVVFDAEQKRLERLTMFPREVTTVG